MDATTMAVDLAKDVFEMALANRAGRITERKRLTRRQFERFVDTLAADTELMMEGCGTAHCWGRRAASPRRGGEVAAGPVRLAVCVTQQDRSHRRR
jgi:hypothetical protein